MSTNVKVMVNMDGDGDGKLDAGVVVLTAGQAIGAWRQLGVEAADALYRVRPDAAPDTLPSAALRRLLVQLDAETYDPTQVVALRDAFLQRWVQLSAR